MANKHRGSSLDDFLKEEGIFDECNTEAVKRVLAYQFEKELKKQKKPNLQKK
ncbi:MAG TPA: hypothetical protein VLE95_02490 [Chlamydiales bacterium]|nr:hypothetical protein [Chlamydiales bacterium]